MIGGRTFNSMVTDLRASRINWDNPKLRAALLKWSRKPTSVVSMCEDEGSREIVRRHAEVAQARMKSWRTATTIWIIVGIGGVAALLFFESKQASNQISESEAASGRGSSWHEA